MPLALTHSKIYRNRAEECRALATLALPGLQAQYLQLAATYELLAEQTELEKILQRGAGRAGAIAEAHMREMSMSIKERDWLGQHDEQGNPL